MKLIDVDSRATLEDFLTLKKRLNLYSFYRNVMKKYQDSIPQNLGGRFVHPRESKLDLNYILNQKFEMASTKYIHPK
jgi:hypothetical protein